MKFLTLKLAQTESKLSEANIIFEKSKNIEKQAKQVLSSKSTRERRQSTMLRQAETKIQSLAKKEEDRVRRRELKHHQLQDELERIEEAYEKQVYLLKQHLNDATQKLESASEFHQQESQTKCMELSELAHKNEHLSSDLNATRAELDCMRSEMDKLANALETSEEALVDSQIKEAAHEKALQQLQDDMNGIMIKAKEADVLVISEREAHADHIGALEKENAAKLEAVKVELGMCNERIRTTLDLKKAAEKELEEKNSSLEEKNAELLKSNSEKDDTINTLESSLGQSKLQCNILQEKYDRSIAEYDEVKQNHRSTELILAESKELCTRMESENAALTFANDDLHNKCISLESSLETSTTSLSTATSELNMSKHEVKDLLKELKAFKINHEKDISALEAQIQCKNASHAKLKDEFDHLLEDCGAAKSALEASTRNIAELKSEMSKKATINSSLIDTLKGSIKSLEFSLINEKDENIEKVNALNDQIAIQNSMYESNLKDLHAEISLMESKQLRLKEELRMVQEENVELKAINSAQKTAIISSKEDLQNALTDLSSQESANQILQEKSDDLEKQIQATRSALDESKQNVTLLESEMSKRASVNTALIDTLRNKINCLEKSQAAERKENEEKYTILMEKVLQVEEEKKSLENKNYTNASTIANLEVTIKEGTIQNDELAIKFSSLKLKHEASLELLEKIKANLENESLKSRGLENNVAQLKSDILDLNSSKSQLEVNFLEKENLLKCSLENGKKLECQVANLTENVTRLKCNLSSLEKMLEGKEAECISKDVEIVELAKANSNLTSQCSAMKIESEQVGKKAETYQKEIDCAQRLLQTKIAEIKSLKSAIVHRDDLHLQLENANTEKFEVIKELTQTRDLLARYKSEAQTTAEIKLEVKKLQDELKLKDSRLNESNRRIFSLEDAVSSLNNLKKEKNNLQDKYNSVLLEQELLLGHSNKKQKIHYLQTLKTQIQELSEENNRLRSLHNK